MTPTLKLRFEKTGTNEFGYRVIEISDFPTRGMVEYYKSHNAERIFQVKAYGEVDEYNMLMLEKDGEEPIIFEEGKITGYIHSDDDMSRIKGMIQKLLDQFYLIADDLDAKMRNVGTTTTLEFKKEEKITVENATPSEMMEYLKNMVTIRYHGAKP